MGDVGSVRALSARFQHRADDLRALNTELTQGLAGLGGWHGQAADRFRENQQRLRLGLDEFVVRFERCRGALDSYAHQMDARRLESNALLPRVLDAQRRLADAQRQILHPTSIDALSRALAVQPWILNELKNLGGVWFRIRAAQDASSLWCGQQLQDSDGTALRDLFHEAGAVLQAGQKKWGELSHDWDVWLHDNADTIAEMSSLLGNVSTVVSFAALAFPALAPVAFGLSIAVAVGKGLAYSGGSKKVSRKDVGMAVLDVGLGSLGNVTKARGLAAFARVDLSDARSVNTAFRLLNQGIAVDKALAAKTTLETAAVAWTSTTARGDAAAPFWEKLTVAHATDMERRATRTAVPQIGQ